MNHDSILIRPAKREDLVEIIKMLADDPLGSLREDFSDPLPDSYVRAFTIIDQDPYQELLVAESPKDGIVGTFQLSFIQYLNYQGGSRGQIESVRVRSDQRNKGLGEFMFKWAIERTKEKGAHMLQLTTDKKRPDALRFYEKLGFVASHEGMKHRLG